MNNTLRVFVASPSDVKRERAIARKVIGEVSRVSKAIGISLVADGWEDVPPGLGRPQGLINPSVEEANLLVGILWKRFGTATGVAESGTREEFDIIKRRFHDGEAVDAMLYFRDVEQDRIDDAGPQLRAVLDFRAEMDRNALYRPYARPKDFEAMLRDHLLEWVMRQGPSGSRPGARKRRAPAFNDLPRGELLQRFKNVQREENAALSMIGLETRIAAPIELERVLIPLRVQRNEFELAGSVRRKVAGLRLKADDVVSFDEIWSQAAGKGLRSFVVLGHPGSGKTTLLRSLLLRCLRAPQELRLAAGSIPLLVPLRSVDVGETLDAAVRRILKTDRLWLPERFFEPALFDGTALLLFDGLDEVISAYERGRVARWLEEQRQLYPNCRMVVSSRFAGYVADAQLQFSPLTLSVEPLRPEDIREFLDRWFVAVETLLDDSDTLRQRGREAATELCIEIEKRSELAGLAANPLMLQIIALVHRGRGKLPDRRVDLYRECVNVLLEHRDRARGIEVPLTAPEARHVLQPVAYWMHQVPDRRYASKAELVPLLRAGLAQFPHKHLEPEAYLDAVRDRSGLFTGYGVDEYGFQHLSFQEFLAAGEIRSRGLFQELVDHYGEVWWREVTRLLMGLENPSCFEDFMEVLVGSDRFLQNHDLTAACIQDAFTPSAKPFAAALNSSIGTASAQSRQYHLLLALRELPPETIGTAVPAIRRVATSARGEVSGDLALELLARAGVELPVARDAATGLPETRINPRDGTELVLIPAGEFAAGHRDESDNKPRRMKVESFYLARYPVTHAQYAKFLEKNPEVRKPEYWDDARFNQPQQPVVGVSWDEAIAYCRWAEMRLPTEWEWEKGARGTDGRPFPWGIEDPDETRANFGGKVGQPTPVGSYPAGASPYGLMDMAGNVWEWTASEYRKGRTRTVRGGAFFYRPLYLRAASRFHNAPGERVSDFGFRCAQDPVTP